MRSHSVRLALRPLAPGEILKSTYAERCAFAWDNAADAGLPRASVRVVDVAGPELGIGHDPRRMVSVLEIVVNGRVGYEVVDEVNAAVGLAEAAVAAYDADCVRFLDARTLELGVRYDWAID